MRRTRSHMRYLWTQVSLLNEKLRKLQEDNNIQSDTNKETIMSLHKNVNAKEASTNDSENVEKTTMSNKEGGEGKQDINSRKATKTQQKKIKREVLKLISYNLNGVRARMKKDDFLQFLREEDADIVCLQEFRCAWDYFLRRADVRQTLDDLGYHFNHYAETDYNVGYAGVVILSRFPFRAINEGVGDKDLDREGRFISMEFEKFILLDAYFPNTGAPHDLKFMDRRLQFDRKCREICETMVKPILFAADFNVVHNDDGVPDGLTHKRWHRHPACTVEERSAFLHLMTTVGLVDVQTEKGVKGYTFFHRPHDRKKNHGMCIDHILATPSLVKDHIVDFSIRSDVLGSDHHPLQLLLNTAIMTRREIANASVHDNLILPPLGQEKEITLPVRTKVSDLHDVEHYRNIHAWESKIYDESRDSGDLPLHSIFANRLDKEALQYLDPDLTGRVEVASLVEELNVDGTWERELFIEPTEFIANCDEEGTPKTIVLPVLDLTVEGKDGVGILRSLADSGATSSVADMKALIKMFGQDFYDKHLDVRGDLPKFSMADNKTVSPLGVVNIDFDFGGVQLNWNFYVLKRCAHPLILGNDFFVHHRASIDYVDGRVVVFEPTTLLSASLSFDLKEPGATPRSTVTLLSEEDVVLPPMHAIRVNAVAPALVNSKRPAPWGFCSSLPTSRVTVPQSVTSLEGGASLVVLTNFSKTETLRVRKNQEIALFTEAERGEYREYMLDLEKLAEGVDPFIDFDTLCEQSEGLLKEQSTCVNTESEECIHESLKCHSDDCVAREEVRLANRKTMVACCGLEDHEISSKVSERQGINERDPCECKAYDESLCICVKEKIQVLDKFSPADDDDVSLIHMRRFTREEVDAMSDEQIEEHFSQGPLSQIVAAKERLNDGQLRKLRELLLLNRDVFAMNDKQPGTINKGGCRIDTGDAKPVQFPKRPTPPNLRPVLDSKIAELQKYGVIEPSNSPWGAAVLLVPKKDGQFRFCVDYRLLNKQTKRDAYPLPRIDDCLTSLTGNEYFTAMDLTSAFWQVPMATMDDREKTAFRTHRGHYQFTKMPMGLVNSPAYMQRYIESALSGLLFSCALVYVDDILIFSPNFEQHLEDIQKVFNALRCRQFHLKAKKCEFAKSEVKFLGHIVGASGIRPDPAKVKCILDGLPESRTEVRAWHGLASYYRRYIKNFAKKVRPLTRYVNSRLPWKGLTEEMKMAIDEIKKALTEEPILAHPDFDKPFEIHCDASPGAIGAVLVQKSEGMEKAIMYVSRALKPAEEKYPQYEREALALYWSINVFRPYVIGKPFTVVTDCKALLYIRSRPLNARVVRWSMALEEYDIDFRHRSGKSHGNADGLTRNNKMPSDANYRGEPDVELLALNENFEKFSDYLDDEGICVIHALQRQSAGVECDGKCGQHIDAPTSTEERSFLEAVNVFFEVTQSEKDDLQLPSLEALKKAQANCPKLKRTLRYVNTLPKDTLDRRKNGKEIGFFLLNGVLMTNTAMPARFSPRDRRGRRQFAQQICVPQSMRRCVLYSVHGLPISGHDGVLKTMLRLRKNFWWKSYARDTKAWVKSCFCQRRKKSRPLKHGWTGTLRAKRPWELVSFDLVGPLPETEDGYVYLLTAIDHFSRYPFAIPVPDKKTATIARALHDNVFTLFGPPTLLLSDCAKEFRNDVIHGVWELWGSKAIHTSGHQPQANGIVERFHRWLNCQLTIFANAKRDDWSDHITSILYAYRTSTHLTTGLTPMELLMGATPKMLPDLIYDLNQRQLSEECRLGIGTSDSMREAYKFVRKRDNRDSQLIKHRLDKSKTPIKFKQGDLVFKYDETFDKSTTVKKLCYKLAGPYVIQDVDGRNKNLYDIYDPKTGTTEHINVNRLLPAFHDMGDLGDPLGWAVPTEEERKPLEKIKRRDTKNKLEPVVTDITRPEEGDMVCIKTEPEVNLPFAIGKVISVKENGLNVQWFGKYAASMITSNWRPGFRLVGGRAYYGSKQHASHIAYTSKNSGTVLTCDHIIGPPFSLTKSGRIPMRILRAVSSSGKVDWSLPAAYNTKAYVNACIALHLRN